ncbi:MULTISPECIES: DUF6691 family protein [Gammaproteobacteria]|jgi:hypothetical protein|uniref:DUF6691 family protein n=1 Tax=Salinisphaera aquimarina TaxID=2094031 RepID=A0ABV7EJH3_9GAMM|tara:strand:+ start:2041 stop:2460 length:420 start_codon:yes stop_codon:yes gene_type:complete
MQYVITLASGLVFGIGLTISGMVNPEKVLAFLDPVGRWDPSLALVMAMALAVFSLTNAFLGKRIRPLFGSTFHRPSSLTIDRRLLSGAALFGVGWGLAGYCPGPALAALVFNFREAAIFLPAILLGGWLADRFLSATRT